MAINPEINATLMGEEMGGDGVCARGVGKTTLSWHGATGNVCGVERARVREREGEGEGNGRVGLLGLFWSWAQSAALVLFFSFNLLFFCLFFQEWFSNPFQTYLN